MRYNYDIPRYFGITKLPDLVIFGLPKNFDSINFRMILKRIFIKYLLYFIFNMDNISNNINKLK